MNAIKEAYFLTFSILIVKLRMWVKTNKTNIQTRMTTTIKKATFVMKSIIYKNILYFVVLGCFVNICSKLVVVVVVVVVNDCDDCDEPLE